MIFCLSVKIHTLFMHCSPDLIGYLFMAVILNSLSGKSLTHIHESVFLEFLYCSHVWNILIYFFLFPESQC